MALEFAKARARTNPWGLAALTAYSTYTSFQGEPAPKKRRYNRGPRTKRVRHLANWKFGPTRRSGRLFNRASHQRARAVNTLFRPRRRVLSQQHLRGIRLAGRKRRRHVRRTRLQPRVRPVQGPANLPLLHAAKPRGRRPRRNTMPRYRRRRRSYKRPYRKGRGRGRYRRGKVRAYRRRAMRRGLRLYAAGFPKTHLVRLRAIAQTRIETIKGGWGAIIFEPNNAHRPFKHMRNAVANGAGTYVTSSQRLLQWTDKTENEPGGTGGQTTALTLRQPYGWDQVLNADGHYKRWMVVGSKITLNFKEGDQDRASTNNLIGGFTKTNWFTDTNMPQSFATKYADVDWDEPMDLLNVKGFKAQAMSDPGIGTTAVGKTFVSTYSLKKLKKRVKREGFEPEHGDATYSSTFAADPATNPYVLFIVMDRGWVDITGLDCIVTCDYTIQLSNRDIPDQSTV